MGWCRHKPWTRNQCLEQDVRLLKFTCLFGYQVLSKSAGGLQAYSPCVLSCPSYFPNTLYAVVSNLHTLLHKRKKLIDELDIFVLSLSLCDLVTHFQTQKKMKNKLICLIYISSHILGPEKLYVF